MIRDPLARIAARLWRGVIVRGAPGGVYLTFDDGPDPATTSKLLARLDELECRATFFLTGALAERNPELVRAVHRSGHVVASHGFDHRPLTFASLRTAREDLARSLAVLSDLIGSRPRLYRPPFGRLSTGLLKAARELELTIALWAVNPADYRAADPARITRRVVRAARPGDIVLLHDRPSTAPRTLAALPLIVRGLREKGLDPKPLESTRAGR